MIQAGQTLLDPFLVIEGMAGNVFAKDDDSGGGLNARIVFSPPTDGDYRIIATAMNNINGDFVLTVKENPKNTKKAKGK